MIDDKIPSRLAPIIIPAQTKDTNIPLYEAIGISQRISDDIHFEMMENILPTCSTNAEALRAIIDHPVWGSREKVWAAFNLDRFAGECAKYMKGAYPENAGFIARKLLDYKANLEKQLDKKLGK